MKVLFDHQIFQYQQIGGISRYFNNLITYLSDKVDCEISIKYSNNQYLLKKDIIKLSPIIDYRSEFLKGFDFIGKGRLFNYLVKALPNEYKNPYLENLKFSIEKIKNQDFNIFHPTYYNPYFLEYIETKPFVLTIHDLIYEVYPEFCKTDDWALLNMQRLAKLASHIIAVSESTKKDIIKFYKIDEKKISVIYHGINKLNPSYFEVKKDFKYLLYVGSRIGYKNFIFFIRSASKVLIDEKMKLICVGNSFTEEEKALFQFLKIENQIIHENADDSQLYSLYKNATAFVYPSLYEGFGMPILEAFSCDCPVILSNNSCFKEIAGNAALYFDPKNVIDIENSLKRLIKDESLRKMLIRIGRKRLIDFSWEKAANETYKVYQSVINFNYR